MCLNPTYASSGTIRGACQWLGLSQVVTGLGLGLGVRVRVRVRVRVWIEVFLA